MFLRIDEKENEAWSPTACLHDALACGMAVTILLDIWRLSFGAVFVGGAASSGSVVFIGN